MPNAFYVALQNTGNVKISCTVIFSYDYPDGKGGVKSSSDTLGTGMLTPSQSSKVTMQLSSFSITNVSYKISCTKWPFA